MKAWKWAGLAGVAGVAATGAVIARGERQRQALTPEDVRHRLLQRHAQVASDHAAPVAVQPAPSLRQRLRAPVDRLRASAGRLPGPWRR